jgi:hypothetical protein
MEAAGKPSMVCTPRAASNDPLHVRNPLRRMTRESVLSTAATLELWFARPKQGHAARHAFERSKTQARAANILPTLRRRFCGENRGRHTAGSNSRRQI